MILKKLYIHNYKSFYDTTIELDKFNIIIGENNSGKSNVIDVLEFIDIWLNEGFNLAISKKGGFEKLLNYNYQENKIFIEFYLDNITFLKKTRITLTDSLIQYSTVIYNSKKIYQISSHRHNILTNKMKNKYYLSEYVTDNNFMKLVPLSHIATTYAFNTQIIRNQSHKKTQK